MTNQQILEKAIQKAIDGGWKINQFCGFPSDYIIKEPTKQTIVELLDHQSNELSMFHVRGLIFDRDFAKALWGEWTHNMATMSLDMLPPIVSTYCTHCGAKPNTSTSSCWQYHLQQMVITEDPIQYLKENI